jgi:RNA polymerase sigma-70 factor (ECF subfamily)
MSFDLLVGSVILRALNDSDQPSESAPVGCFHTTHWTEVLAAGEANSPGACEALARLCQTYWLPVYAFIRKRGHAPHQAQDFTQEFFAEFLEKGRVAQAVRERGRFRSFLMSSVQNFLRDAHDRNQAQKRGGGVPLISLHDQDAEALYLQVHADDADPAVVFDQRWASTLLQTVLFRLRDEFVMGGKLPLFEALQSHIWGDADSLPYPVLAEQFGMSVANVKITAHRLRVRYRELLREEIARTVSHPGEIDDEIRHLMQVVSQ